MANEKFDWERATDLVEQLCTEYTEDTYQMLVEALDEKNVQKLADTLTYEYDPDPGEREFVEEAYRDLTKMYRAAGVRPSREPVEEAEAADFTKAVEDIPIDPDGRTL